MELSDLTNKYKNVTFNIALIILAIMVSVSMYKKQNKAIELLNQQKGNELKKNDILEDIGRLEKKINSYKSVFVKKDTDLVIGNLNNFAKESGIRITSIKPTPEQRYNDYTKFPYELDIKASSYHGFGKFISKLESSRDIFLVENIMIKFEETNRELNILFKLSYIALN
jgi:Tfp pilus assembly protein PilO